MTADIIVIAVIGLSAFIGYIRGFIKSVSKLCCWIIAIILGKILNPYVSGFVKDSFLGEFIREKINEKASGLIPEELPLFFRRTGEATVNGIADTVTEIVSVLLIVIITFIIANLILKALNIVVKLPVISTANKFLGIVAGFVTGVLVVYLVLGLISAFGVHDGQEWLEQSIIAYTMYRHNIFMNFIF